MFIRLATCILMAASLAIYSCVSNNSKDVAPNNTNTGNTTTGGNNTGGSNVGLIPDTVSLSLHISPIFNKYSCTSRSCHGGSNAPGGVNLGAYNGISIVAKNGRLYGSISHAQGFDAMPSFSQKLTDTELAIVKKWIDNGALNN